MKKMLSIWMLSALCAGSAWAQTAVTPVSLEAIVAFLKEAGLQTCRAEAMDPAASRWNGTIASYWLEISEDCAGRQSHEEDILHVHQFNNTEDRDRMISSYLSNRPRGIVVNASIWPVSERLAVAAIGSHQAKYRVQLEKAFMARQEKK